MLKPKKVIHYYIQILIMHLRGTLLCTKISIYKKQDQQKHQTQGQYLLSLSRTESSAKEISSKRKKLPSFMARTRGPSCHSKSRDVSISSYNLEKEVKLKGVCLQDNTHMASWCLLQWSGHSATSHAKVWEPGTQATQQDAHEVLADQWKYVDTYQIWNPKPYQAQKPTVD